MPYEIVPNHEDCNSGEYGLVQENTGELVGCHSSESDAEDQRRAIQANKSDIMHLHNILVAPTFDEIKDLDDKGLFGGYLVKFGSPEKHDLEKDFFTKETDFWLEDGEGKTAVLWGHGKDEHFGTKRLDKNWGRVVLKDAGLWMETQLQRRNKYEEMVQKLAKQGKLGLSSGTASHLVEREESEKDGVTHIKRWPIGLDGTLTPTPAEPRIKVKPLDEVEDKSLKETALKVLGTDIPAGMGSTVDEMTVGQGSQNDEKEVSLRNKIRTIKGDFRSQFNNDNSSLENAPRPRQVFENYIIVKWDGKFWRVNYSGSISEGYEFDEKSDWTEVVKDSRYIARETAKTLDEMLEKIGDRDGTSKSDESSGILSTLDELNNMV